MTFGASLFGETLLGNVNLGALAPAAPDSGGGTETPPVVTTDPFRVEISGVSFYAMNNSLTIDTELGRQGTASFDLVNLSSGLRQGQPVRVLFYDHVLFAGSIDRINTKADLSHRLTITSCECVDHSFLLTRRRVRRNLTNVSLTALAISLLNNELYGDGMSLGTVDSGVVIPQIDADNTTAFDLLNDAAIAVGVLFYVDSNKKLQFISTSIALAPMTVDETIAEDVTVTSDRETFINKINVTVTGTPASTSDPAQVVNYATGNTSLVSQQAGIEGTTGIYSDLQSITHPTSNDPVMLTRFAVSYAKTFLAVQGSLRETLSVRTRQFGFQVGQIAQVSIPHLGRSGSYCIQSVSMSDEEGKALITKMDLSPTTLRKRSQALWLDVVRKSSVVIVPPVSVFTNSQTFATPGTFSFTVPVGATFVQISCFGAGGGGGGGAFHTITGPGSIWAAGSAGGNGGLAIYVLDVTPGQVLSVTVGAGGAGGAFTVQVNDIFDVMTSGPNGQNGTDGGLSRVQRSGITYCQAYGGQHGFGGQANKWIGTSVTFQKAPDASGFGQSVTTGGGSAGGIGGFGNPISNGENGRHGQVLLEW